ncbi:MAG: hypothetical protein P8X39_06325 [Desulfofustis sp.]
MGRLVLSYDVVGDIAIVIVPPDLSHREAVIARAIRETNKKIKVVAKRESDYQGEFRTLNLKIIGGEKRKETVHKEFGIRLMLNLEKVYFSVRSSTERRRVAALVKPGENVLVMFSGIAPYPLYIDRFSEASSISGIEKNPAAHRYAEQNLILNRAQGKIRLYLGDVRQLCPQLGSRFDRVVMPLPKAGFEYVPAALSCLKNNGRMHFYTIQSADTINKTLRSLGHLSEENGRRLTDAQTTICGHTGPKDYRYCIDAVIS